MNVKAQSSGEAWVAYCGDSAEVLKGIPDKRVDLSIYSPPFSQLYTYSSTERDLGNCRDDTQFFQQYDFILREMLRATKPGRHSAVHVAQVPLLLSRDGVIGLSDFRGDVIRAHTSAGWIFHGEITIDKDPQAQAIRTKSKALLFTQLRKDASWLRPALADYVLIFRAPGENAVPIHPDLTNNEWIEWARPIWYGLRENDTLHVAEAREHEDERHICPLQLGTIERCIRLWSNPGETVLDPFMGIGSVPYEAVRLGRRGAGVELKDSYFRAAVRNLQAAERTRTSGDLFSVLAEVGA